ncbi:hypothetical protein LIER_31951 [Lithospermum erythrorhizon]|uniref:Uncharacterized protein n=1 Tax=Lithospermum erythrorhizon TaxID=34254 RepID=A0AAV3RSL5_LITER
MLRNVEQYQQPTLGSQLYPGRANSGFQAGPPAPSTFISSTSQLNPPLGQRIPQGIAPVQAPQGFMPVNNLGVPRSGMHPSQPASPMQLAPARTPMTLPAPPPPPHLQCRQLILLMCLVNSYLALMEISSFRCECEGSRFWLYSRIQRVFKWKCSIICGSFGI